MTTIQGDGSLLHNGAVHVNHGGSGVVVSTSSKEDKDAKDPKKARNGLHFDVRTDDESVFSVSATGNVQVRMLSYAILCYLYGL